MSLKKLPPGERSITSRGFAKRCGLKEYHIPFDVFNFVVVLVVGPIEGLEEYIRWKHDEPDFKLSPQQFTNAQGLTVYKRCNVPIIWLPRRPATAKEYGYLAHEMLHAVRHLTDYVGLGLSDDTEELFCYALAHGVETALHQMGMKQTHPGDH